jgi:hypothetical protein
MTWQPFSHRDRYRPTRLGQFFARLQAIQIEAGKLRGIFGNLVMAWTLQQPGITKEMLDAEFEARLRAKVGG